MLLGCLCWRSSIDFCRPESLNLRALNDFLFLPGSIYTPQATRRALFGLIDAPWKVSCAQTGSIDAFRTIFGALCCSTCDTCRTFGAQPGSINVPNATCVALFGFIDGLRVAHQKKMTNRIPFEWLEGYSICIDFPGGASESACVGCICALQTKAPLK